MRRYLTAEEYTCLTGNRADDETEHLIQRASEQIDTLTFHRIVTAGIENLTQFQQDRIKVVCARQTAFLAVYGYMADSPLSSYSIGNVSMNWDGDKTVQVSGVTMQAETYEQLLQTGLCRRVLRR